MTRTIKNLVVLVYLFGSVAAGAPVSQESEPSGREIVWRALLLTLEQRDLAVGTASEKEGRIVSEFRSLDPDAVPKAAILSEQDKKRKWIGAEYRYQIDLGKRLFIRTEIRAWERAENNAPAPANVKTILRSNRVFEKEFLRDLGPALAKVDSEMHNQ